MTSRERVRAAINHRQPDRVPIDFGSTSITGIHCSVVAALRDHYGLEKRPVKVCEPYQMLGLVEDDLLEAMGVGCRRASSPATRSSVSPTKTGRPGARPGARRCSFPNISTPPTDANGDLLIYPKGDTSAPPSGHMPKAGYFFDSIIRQEPIDEDNLNPEDNLEEFKPIMRDRGHAAYWRGGGRAARHRPRRRSPTSAAPRSATSPWCPRRSSSTRRASATSPSGTCPPPSAANTCTRSSAGRARSPSPTCQAIHDAVGDALDVVVLCGTDFGTQTSIFCSVDTFRDLWLPLLQADERLDPQQHQLEDLQALLRRGGGVHPPFHRRRLRHPQPGAVLGARHGPGRSSSSAYGDRITFWGGGVNTQKTLPFGTPEEVREQVLDAAASSPPAAASSSTPSTTSRPGPRRRTSSP